VKKNFNREDFLCDIFETGVYFFYCEYLEKIEIEDYDFKPIYDFSLYSVKQKMIMD